MSLALTSGTATSTAPEFAEVALPVHVFQTFTYRLRPWMRHEARVGGRIQVPLGRTVVTGYIVALHDRFKADQGVEQSDIKDAENILDSHPVLTPEMLELTRWVSDYYASPWGEVIKAALPPGISPAVKSVLSLTELGQAAAESQPSTTSTLKAQVLAAIAGVGEIALAELKIPGPKTPLTKVVRELEQEGLIKRVQRSGRAVRKMSQRAVRLATIQTSVPAEFTLAQRRVLETISKRQPMLLQELLKSASVSVSVVNTLVKKGAVEIFEQEVRRDPLRNAELTPPAQYTLTAEQKDVLGEIEQQLTLSTYSAFLLKGVTGSGKTEVYIRAMRTALKQGRSALMLVPEIALTPLFSRRLRSEFGDLVAIFHSSLPKGERFDEWMRVKNGEERVVIGTRSAVFAPVSELGLLIVDEEHESTYRQQDSPYYNARDTAIVRAQKQSATVIIGSATPSLESFHNARSGKYRYLLMSRRIGNRPLADSRIIDMRAIFARHGRAVVFSDELLDAIQQNQARKEQSIMLLNRRGFSSFVLCRSCGETVQCPNCDVTLTYHRSERVLICHYCNHRQPPPSQCSVCGRKYIFYVGEGTEQIEHLLRKLFPKLRIARIDRDTTSRHREFEKSLLDFAAGRLDMLVGTQMLAKGHDFPNVTLVGVVSVDAGLALPDFRAAERTFQLITQVAGRAGRGERTGQVLIQTYHPNHYAVRYACAQDYTGFYNEELRYRQNHLYPPFVALGLLLLHSKDLQRLRSESIELRRELDLVNKDRLCRILGPAPAPLARLKSEHRIQILIKSHNRRQLRVVSETALKNLISRGLNPRSVNLEIDPVSMM